MTATDIIILGACGFISAIYIVWLWCEVKNAAPFPYDTGRQNEGVQTHETTSNEETPSSETKTQQEVRK